MAVTEDTPLRGKQPAFVEQYFIQNFNGKAAAEAAGYKGNDSTLSSIASENLRKPNIAAAIRARMEDLAMQRNEALARLAQMARATFEDALTFPDDGEPYIDLRKARDAGVLHLVKDVVQEEVVIDKGDDDELLLRRRTRVKFHDAMKALFRILDETKPRARKASGKPDDPIHMKHGLDADTMAAMRKQADDEVGQWRQEVQAEYEMLEQAKQGDDA